jgi:serine/threonine protein kinase/Tfp pilus assembly protein PilF
MATTTVRPSRRSLDPARWQTLKSILADALKGETPAARAEALPTLCGTDAEMLQEARSLLAEAEVLLRDPADLIEQCAETAGAGIPREDVSEIGSRIGAYVIVRKIADGGMGTVYLAARADGYFEKQVAIKVLRRDLDNEELMSRFRSEREVLAKLDHPNIARLIDAGTREDGSPYFVMEYVAGVPITTFVEQKGLSVDERLALFLKICAAVDAAHHHSIVHRDLKPSNIVVNDEGEPKLLDFGIAKMLESDTSALEATAFGKERFTPISASPEQARGEAITVTSDVYALGVVLYEMLSGARPHRFTTNDPSRDELLEVVCEQRPLRPSLAAKNPKTQRALRGSLDAVLLHALEKDPQDRYQSVAEFAEDLRRYRDGKPVRARHADRAYRLQRLLLEKRRVQIPVFAAVVALVGLAAFFLHAYLKAPGETRPVVTSAPLEKPDKSIAVLPFTNVGTDSDTDYFVDGFQEDILTNLAKVSDLKVISRTSVLAYGGTIINAREIGKALGVSFLLEGSVQKAGDRIRLNVRLVDARTEREVWAEQYDRQAGDVFAIQSELSQAIITQLQARLSQTEKAAIESRPTQDLLAYDFYLQAKESFFQDNCLRATQLLEASLLRDPKFALAYCLLAEVHLYAYRYAGDLTPGRLAKAREAADTALRLRPDLPESHLANAQFYFYGLRDFEKARQELTAAAGAPIDQAKFLDMAALIEGRLGQWREAIRDGHRAMELDPNNPFIANELVESYIAVRQFEEANRLADEAMKVTASQGRYLWLLKSEIFLKTGKLEEARAAVEKSGLDGAQRAYRLSRLARFQRDYGKAREDLAKVPSEARQGHAYAFCQGLIARASGDGESARTWFQTARERILPEMEERPNDPQLTMDIAVIDAGLGRKEDARRESEALLRLAPLGRDAVDGPLYAAVSGQIHSWIGDTDPALAELSRIVTVPCGPTEAELKLDPGWDDLRSDPRFAALVARAAEPIVLP